MHPFWPTYLEQGPQGVPRPGKVSSLPSGILVHCGAYYQLNVPQRSPAGSILNNRTTSADTKEYKLQSKSPQDVSRSISNFDYLNCAASYPCAELYPNDYVQEKCPRIMTTPHTVSTNHVLCTEDP